MLRYNYLETETEFRILRNTFKYLDSNEFNNGHILYSSTISANSNTAYILDCWIVILNNSD